MGFFSKTETETQESAYDVTAVDDVVAAIETNTKDLKQVAKIDHHRLAKECGEAMPPSCLVVISDPKVNIPLIQENPRVGLDLPYRFLSFYEPSASVPSVAYTSSDFLKARHGVKSIEALKLFQDGLDQALVGIDKDMPSPVDGDGIELNYGLVELTSSHDFVTTESLLKDAVTSQGDTVWFDEVDYCAQSKEQDPDSVVAPCKLLLFGGPKPGAKAMKEFTKLGLIAFCQKMLILQDGDGIVKVLFNDIEKINELHYSAPGWFDFFSTLPHKVINYRLKKTFSNAIK